MIKAKRVKGYIEIKELGRYDFDFYVEDDATDEEIKKKIEDNYGCIHYDVEDGYKITKIYKSKD